MIADVWVPLYEAKLIHQYDHRFATFADGPVRPCSELEQADPAQIGMPRYWLPETARPDIPEWMLTMRAIARATDRRTVIAAILPGTAVSHTLTLITTATPRDALLLLGVLNSMPLDFVARTKIGGSQVGQFHLAQLPIPTAIPPLVAEAITTRALELTYTTWTLRPFARGCGYTGTPFPWDAERRHEVRAEIDALVAHLYGLSRADFGYILDQFPIARKNDMATYGEYRTKRLCLAAYDAFAGHPGLERAA